MVKNPPASAEDTDSIPDWEDPLEKGMATHSSILAWRISQMKSLVGYSSWGFKESDTTEQVCRHMYISISIYISHFVFICSVVSGHLGCYLFHVLAIVNSTAMTTRVHVPFKIKVFSRYGPRSRIAGQFGNSNFSFLRNLNTVFHSGCTQLPFHPFPFSPHPLQQLLLIDFLTMVILTVWR